LYNDRFIIQVHASKTRHLRLIIVPANVDGFSEFHFHLFAEKIAIYKADTVILGCRSPQGNNLLRGAYRKNKVKKIKSKEIG